MSRKGGGGSRSGGGTVNVREHFRSNAALDQTEHT